MEQFPPGMGFSWPSWLIYCPKSSFVFSLWGLTLFGMILFTCFVHCLFPFLECEVPESRTFRISWDEGRASATTVIFLWRISDLPLPVYFSESGSYPVCQSGSMCRHSPNQTAHSIGWLDRKGLFCAHDVTPTGEVWSNSRTFVWTFPLS